MKRGNSFVCILYDRKNVVAYGAAHFEPGTGPIIYYGLVCTGNESDLSDCRHAVPDHTNCHHSKDVGVSCSKSFEIFMDYNYVTSRNCFFRTCYYLLMGTDLALSEKQYLTWKINEVLFTNCFLLGWGLNMWIDGDDDFAQSCATSEQWMTV